MTLFNLRVKLPKHKYRGTFLAEFSLFIFCNNFACHDCLYQISFFFFFFLLLKRLNFFLSHCVTTWYNYIPLENSFIQPRSYLVVPSRFLHVQICQFHVVLVSLLLALGSFRALFLVLLLLALNK